MAIAEWRMYRTGNTALLEPLSETKILLNPMLESQMVTDVADSGITYEQLYMIPVRGASQLYVN